MRIALAISLALISSSALACNLPNCKPDNTTVIVNQDGSVRLSSSNTAISASQGGKATSSSTSQGGQGGNASSNVTFTTPRSQTIRSVGVAPDIVANPTAPCRVAVGVSGGWIGGALGLSGSVLDEGCDTRADATMLWALGLEDAAVARLCQKDEMTEALGSLCPSKSPTSSTAFNH